MRLQNYLIVRFREPERATFVNFLHRFGAGHALAARVVIEPTGDNYVNSWVVGPGAIHLNSTAAVGTILHEVGHWLHCRHLRWLTMTRAEDACEEAAMVPVWLAICSQPPRFAAPIQKYADVVLGCHHSGLMAREIAESWEETDRSITSLQRKVLKRFPCLRR